MLPRSKTKLGTCKLCVLEKELQLSHAIPNSVFNSIKRANSGKLIALSGDDSEIVFTSDSLAEFQLCADCESKLNHNYEAYSLAVLRNQHNSITRAKGGLYISNIEPHKLIIFFISIFWRAANSSHRTYKLARVIDEYNEELRCTINEGIEIPLNRFAVKLAKLTDENTSDGFSNTDLRDVIAPPIPRTNYYLNTGRVSYFFIFLGFYVEIIFPPGIGFKERNKKGVLLRDRNAIFIPDINVLDIPEFAQLLLINQKKIADGRCKVKMCKKKHV